MPETIEIYAESIEDISPLSHNSLSITLAGIDLGQLISEIGEDIILSEIGREHINTYLEETAQDEEADDE